MPAPALQKRKMDKAVVIPKAFILQHLPEIEKLQHSDELQIDVELVHVSPGELDISSAAINRQNCLRMRGRVGGGNKNGSDQLAWVRGRLHGQQRLILLITRIARVHHIAVCSLHMQPGGVHFPRLHPACAAIAQQGFVRNLSSACTVPHMHS